jgi:hypothetical protein
LQTNKVDPEFLRAIKDSSEQFRLAVSAFSRATTSITKLASTIVQSKSEADAKFSSSMDAMSGKLEELVKTMKSEQKNKSKSKFHLMNPMLMRRFSYAISKHPLSAV